MWYCFDRGENATSESAFLNCRALDLFSSTLLLPLVMRVLRDAHPSPDMVSPLLQSASPLPRFFKLQYRDSLVFDQPAREKTQRTVKIQTHAVLSREHVKVSRK